MRFSTVLKVVGAATLAAGLLPHKVSMDDETGEMEVNALLWQVKRDAAGQYALNLLPKLSQLRKDESEDYDDAEFEDLFNDETNVNCDLVKPAEAETTPAEASETTPLDPMDNLDKYSGIEMQYNDEPINSAKIHDVLDNISYEKTDIKMSMPTAEANDTPAEEKKD